MERLTSSGDLNNETSLLTRLGQMSFPTSATSQNQNNLTTGMMITNKILVYVHTATVTSYWDLSRLGVK